MKYNHRYIARFTVETDTPLSVGSGEKGLLTDRLVARDANGLPYIPGTGLTGVLRHSFADNKLADDIFGSGGENGTGSRLIVSSALLVSEDGHSVIEGLQKIERNSGYYAHFSKLPERDHVRMNDKGAADTKGHGKYDEELVHKGTRFVFEIELIGNASDGEKWKQIIAALSSPVFRIGAGTRKGFGKLKIITEKSKHVVYDLLQNDHLKLYLQKSASLNYPNNDWLEMNHENNSKQEGWKLYQLSVAPQNFFLFGAGFGDEDADNIPKTERFFDWSSGKPILADEDFLLLPGTSIKGTIAHRVAYHYNKEAGTTIGTAGKVELLTGLNVEKALQTFEDELDINNINYASDSLEWTLLESRINGSTFSDNKGWKNFVDDLNEEVSDKANSNLPTGENNEAVKTLFGFSKDSGKKIIGQRGHVIISDVYLPLNPQNKKVFNHTKIDRFTNGTIDGALFQEKAVYYNDRIQLEIWVNEIAFKSDDKIKKAFEQALDDILTGQLQLGGNSTKGHGLFKGSLKTL